MLSTARAEIELERFVAIIRRIEFGPVRQRAAIMHGHALARYGFRARADLYIFDQQLLCQFFLLQQLDTDLRRSTQIFYLCESVFICVLFINPLRAAESPPCPSLPRARRCRADRNVRTPRSADKSSGANSNRE